MTTSKQVRVRLRLNPDLSRSEFEDATTKGQLKLARWIFFTFYANQLLDKKGKVFIPNLEKICLAAVKNGNYRLLRWLVQYGPRNYEDLYIAASVRKDPKIQHFLVVYNMFSLAVSIKTNSPRLHPGLYLSTIFNSVPVIRRLIEIYPLYTTKLLHYLTQKRDTSHIMWIVHNIPLTTDHARIIFEYCMCTKKTQQLMRSTILHLLDDDYSAFYMAMCIHSNVDIISYVSKLRSLDVNDIAVHIYELRRLDVLDIILKHNTLCKEGHNLLLKLVCTADDIETADILKQNGYDITIYGGHIIKWTIL